MCYSESKGYGTPHRQTTARAHRRGRERVGDASTSSHPPTHPRGNSGLGQLHPASTALLPPNPADSGSKMSFSITSPSLLCHRTLCGPLRPASPAPPRPQRHFPETSIVHTPYPATGTQAPSVMGWGQWVGQDGALTHVLLQGPPPSSPPRKGGQMRGTERQDPGLALFMDLQVSPLPCRLGPEAQQGSLPPPGRPRPFGSPRGVQKSDLRAALP